MSTPKAPFDRARRRQHRRRFAGGPDFLRRAIEERLLDRLDDIRTPLGRVLVLGAQDGGLADAIRGRPGVDAVVTADELAPADVLLDEELLPFREGAFSTVLSAMSLHWVNDLPGLLAQVRHCLAADGLLLAAFPGGETLHELRQALLAAELDVTGGAGLRLSPMIDVRDAGALLQRAGFALPVADVERLTVRYAEPLRLLMDLRAMGEAQALGEGARGPLHRPVLGRLDAILRERFADPDGKVRASFDIVTMTGWKPHASQPRPLRRGSGEVSLAKALGVPLEVLQGKAKKP
ncbi:MAG: methyltransferase domain-containing protein [Geminicoccaceae bacterium]|nr:methyltransferase domain-containing protein [Geminicoccaceae bacterium]